MSLKTLFTLIVPGALTLVVAGTLLLTVPGAPGLAQAARGYPLVALGLAALLAWRMHRSRLFILAALLVAVYLFVPPAAATDDTVWRALAATLLPLLAAALSFATDRNVLSRTTVVQVVVSAAFVTAGVTALVLEPTRFGALITWTFVDPIYTSWTGLEQPAMIAALLGLGTVTAIALRREKSTDAGLGWATLAALLSLAAPPQSTARGIWMLAAGLVVIIALVETAYVMAYHDELTGLPARRALNQTLASLRAPYTVAIVDVDHFKSFNDRYGHDVGDEVLRMVASRLERVTGGGRAFRSGGEEFTIVFAGRTRKEALPHLEQVREAVAEARFTLRKKPRPKKKEGERRRGTRLVNEKRIGVTISVGLAGADARNPTTESVVKAADKAMYRAKQGGRNRVVA